LRMVIAILREIGMPQRDPLVKTLLNRFLGNR
jgi:hypothetical protein